MKYAIIRLGGKQFKISEGNTISVERQSEPLNIEVLSYADGEDISIGNPTLDNIDIKVKMGDETKEKTRVARFRAKSRHRRVYGHKQPFSAITIEKISKKDKKEVKETKEVNK